MAAVSKSGNGGMSRYGKVAVLMGGRSAERAISLNSGMAVLEALQAAGIDAHGLDAGDADFARALAEGGYARVFIALHGRGGEDGVVQGLLDVLGLPYTGSGVLASALAMHKLRTKQVWSSADIPTPPFTPLPDAGAVEAVKDTLVYPLVVKPAHEGSSIGITKVENPNDLLAAWQLARRYDTEVFAEQWIAGQEFTAGILDAEALPLIRLVTPNTFYDYDAKYLASTTRYLIPCGLEPAREQALQAQSLAAFRAVGGTGWGRVDFMLDGSGAPWFIEVNTIPGLTDHSLVPMAARATGLDFTQLVCRILDATLAPQNAGAGERHAPG